VSDLTNALDALMAQHQRIGSPVPGYLRPGLPADSVRERISASVGLDASPDVIDVFAWHDGIDNEAWVRDGVGTGFARLFGDAYFAPLDGAVREYRERIETDEVVARYSTPDSAVETWRRSWFPAFCQGWDTYAVECDQGRSDYGRVYDPAWDPPTGDYPAPRFRDLLHLVGSTIRRFEADGYWWDPAARFLEGRSEILHPLYEREIAEARAVESPPST
jgi:hypothetical protein